MKNLSNSIQQFSDKRILVLGDIMLDEFIYGKIVEERLNPEDKATPLARYSHTDYFLGGAGNVANNISSLGARAYLIGVVGRDFYGRKLIELCEKNQIFLHPFDSENSTIVKQRQYFDKKYISRLDFGENDLKKIDPYIAQNILKKIKKADFSNLDAVILSGYNKYFFTQGFSQELINLFKELDIKVLADPKPENINFFMGCYLVSPNLKEAEKITGEKFNEEKPKDSLKNMAQRMSLGFNLEKVIITCGEKGVFGYNKKTNSDFFVEAKAKQVSDQTGAGDTFIAAYTLADVSNFSFEDSLEIASQAAGIVVQKVGTATAAQDELIKSLSQ